MTNEIKCPKCGSTQLTAQKKGYSATKGVAGAFLTGGVGLLAGFHGSSDIDITCLSCGNKWNPEKLHKQTEAESMREDIQKYNEWKNEFYHAYESKDFSYAEEIYLANTPERQRSSDVHAAYKFLKTNDRQLTIIGVIAAAIVIGIFALLLKWLA
ncbi:hypothetical protein QTN47_27145 [Danxiaibacter flavus]|uniref:Uncharacterized protein n=1 Tax=Danxiaibacter flavus TaxID=3049108 RepID=A0ABV3ZPM9_9BACT|nr:hypothetical protein QNM32_27145 [Chitinophagaceae bacterium DXS]